MTKHELFEAFYNNHLALMDYTDALPVDQFMLTRHGKWTAGQQLHHVYLCLKPIAQALASKDFIRQTFGTLDREIMEYGEVIVCYKRALEDGGAAPERFLPEPVQASQKQELLSGLQTLLHSIQQAWNTYTEKELSTLVLPHPLLGNLSIRELFYLMAFHATHHHRQVVRSLKQQAEVSS